MLVALALLAASCSRDLTRADLVESFQASHPDATADQAGCVVDRLIDDHGLDGVERELDEPVRSSLFARSQYEAEFLCGRTDDVRDQVLALLVDRRLDPDDAECVADELTARLDADDLDVLIDGTMTDDFFDDYFVAVESCDALPG